ncbi:hypothetical protein ACFGVS_17030 [Mucilaginibacter sp. AW1-7]|uniref:hypothetical protein n=1 Tax=Mucilaginibacter sp. AW1-7 TaxID=3349874 RepID=UPI003F73A961
MKNLKITIKIFAATATVLIFIPGIITIAPVMAAPIKQQAHIMADTPLKAFEGIYQLKENEYMSYQIYIDNGKLVAKMLNNKTGLLLSRKSDLSFEVTDADGDETSTIVFSKNEAGEITQAILAGSQYFIRVKNIPPIIEVKLSAAQLKVVEGKYQLEGKTDLFLQLTATENGLLLKQLWDNQEISFMPLNDLLFLNKERGFPLKFSKDIAGNIVKVVAFNRDTWDKVKP